MRWVSQAVWPLLWLLFWSLSCAAPRGGWDVSALEHRYPALSRLASHRLADTVPHFMPDEEGATLFLCRWRTGLPLAVSLPSDASSSELRALRVALAAWQAAGLGVTFVEVERALAQIEIRFAEAERWTPVGAGDTIADCRIMRELAAPQTQQRLEAELEHASVYLRRSDFDAVGRDVPLSYDELLGAALHEIGHALGLAGHVADRSSVMQRSPEGVRRVGRRVAQGQPFGDASLAALYAMPSGVVVGQIGVPARERALLRRAVRLARDLDWRGPYARAADASARIFWRAAQGRLLVLEVMEWQSVLSERGSLVLELNPLARRLLREGAGANDRRGGSQSGRDR